MSQSSPSPLVAACGTEEAPAVIRRLAVGALSFDLEAGKLRYIRFAGIEVLRSIAFVVRGPGWETLPPEISDIEIVEGGPELKAHWHANYQFGRNRLQVAARVSAGANGNLRFEAEAQALTDFSTARTSFCVLHPCKLAGHGLQVTHSGESVEKAAFPDAVSAFQPFTDIRALSHEVSDGFRATVRMEGDVWEMEDQRNWTDASFKTYGRPLSMPWPYTIEAGSKLKQTTTLTLEGKAPRTTIVSAPVIEAKLAAQASGRLPDLALAVSSAEAVEALKVDRYPPLAPRGLVGWFRLGEQGPDDLRHYAELARHFSAEISLELILPCQKQLDQEMAEAARIIAGSGLKPASITPIQAPFTKWLRKKPAEVGMPDFGEVYAAARIAFPDVAIGAGMLSNFTELNINRPSLKGTDYVTHCTAHVIHEADDRSVMETLETLPQIFRSVRDIAGEMPYRIGPSAMGMRYNPYGESTEPNERNIRIAFTHQDPRHRGLFGAAFAVGYFARAASAGIESVCFGAPTGPFGLVYRKMAHPQPWFDGQSGQRVYPLYHVLAAIAQGKGAALRPLESSDEKRLLGLGWQRADGEMEAWLANLTAEPQTVRIGGLAGSPRVQRLDAENFERATRDPQGFGATAHAMDVSQPLSLLPYAVIRIISRG
jgi:hypothetical protein